MRLERNYRHISYLYSDRRNQHLRISQTGDYPFLADRDGDGKDDPMVRRPSEGRWYYLASDSNYDLKQVDFGREANDVPVLGYYDDDDRIDLLSGVMVSGICAGLQITSLDVKIWEPKVPISWHQPITMVTAPRMLVCGDLHRHLVYLLLFWRLP